MADAAVLKRKAERFSNQNIQQGTKMLEQLSPPRIDTRVKENIRIAETLRTLEKGDMSKDLRKTLDNIHRILDKSGNEFSLAKNLLENRKNEEVLIHFNKAAELQKAAGYASIAISQSTTASAESKENLLKAFALFPSTAVQAVTAFETIALYSVGHPWAASTLAAASMMIFSRDTREAVGLSPVEKSDYVLVAATFVPFGRVSLSVAEIKQMVPEYRAVSEAIKKLRALVNAQISETTGKAITESLEHLRKIIRIRAGDEAADQLIREHARIIADTVKRGDLTGATNHLSTTLESVETLFAKQVERWVGSYQFKAKREFLKSLLESGDAQYLQDLTQTTKEGIKILEINQGAGTARVQFGKSIFSAKYERRNAEMIIDRVER